VPGQVVITIGKMSVVEQLKDQVANLEQSLATILRELVTQHDQLTAVQAEASQAQTVAHVSTQVATEAKAALQTWEAEELRRRQEFDGFRREVEALRDLPHTAVHSRDLPGQQLFEIKEQATAMSSKLEVEMLQHMKVVRAEQREDLAVLHAEQRKHAEDSAQFRRELWSLRETMPSGRAVQSLNERCAELDRALMSQREEQQQLTSGFRAVQECLTRWQTRWPALTSKQEEFAEELKKYREDYLQNHKVTLEKMTLVETNIQTFASAITINEAATGASKTEAVDMAAIRSVHDQMAADLATLRKDHEQLQKTLEAKHVEAINAASSVSADLLAQKLEHQSHLREVVDHIQVVENKHPEAMKSLAALQEEVMTHRLEHQNNFKSALDRLGAVEGKSGEALQSLSTVTEALMSHRLENQNRLKSALDRIQTVEGKSAEAVNSTSSFATDLMSHQHEHRTTLMEVIGRVEGLEAKVQEAARSVPLNLGEFAAASERIQAVEAKHREVTASLSALSSDLAAHRVEQQSSHLEHQTSLNGMVGHIRAVESSLQEAATLSSTQLPTLTAQHGDLSETVLSMQVKLQEVLQEARTAEVQKELKEVMERVRAVEEKHEEASRGLEEKKELTIADLSQEQVKQWWELVDRIHAVEAKQTEATTSLSTMSADMAAHHLEQQNSFKLALDRIQVAEAKHAEALHSSSYLMTQHIEHEKKVTEVMGKIQVVERQLPEDHELLLKEAAALERLQALEEKQAEAITALQVKQDALDKVQAVEAKHIEVLEAHASLEAKLTQAMIVVESKHTEALRALEVASNQHQQQLSSREATEQPHAAWAASFESAIRREVSEYHSQHQSRLDNFMREADKSLQKLVVEVEELNQARALSEIHSRALSAAEEQPQVKQRGVEQEAMEQQAVQLEKISLRTQTVESQIKQISAALTSGWIASRLEALENEGKQIKLSLTSGQIPVRLNSLELKLKEVESPVPVSTRTAEQITTQMERLESNVEQLIQSEQTSRQMASRMDFLESAFGQIKTSLTPEQMSSLFETLQAPLVTRIQELEAESTQVGAALQANLTAVKHITTNLEQHRALLEEATRQHWEHHHERITELEATTSKHEKHHDRISELEAAKQNWDAPLQRIDEMERDLKHLEDHHKRITESEAHHHHHHRRLIELESHRQRSEDHHERLAELEAQIQKLAIEKSEKLEAGESPGHMSQYSGISQNVETLVEDVEFVKEEAACTTQGLHDIMDHLSVLREAIRAAADRHDNHAEDIESLKAEVTTIKEEVPFKEGNLLQTVSALKQEAAEAMQMLAVSLNELQSLRKDVQGAVEKERSAETSLDDLRTEVSLTMEMWHKNSSELREEATRSQELRQWCEESLTVMAEKLILSQMELDKNREEVRSFDNSLSQVVASVREGFANARESTQKELEAMQESLTQTHQEMVHKKCEEVQSSMHASIHQKCDEVHSSLHQKYEEMHRGIHQKCEDMQTSMHSSLHQKCEDMRTGVHDSFHQKFEDMRSSVHDTFHQKFEDMRSSVHDSFHEKFEDARSSLHESLHERHQEAHTSLHTSVHQKCEDMHTSFLQRHEKMQATLLQKHEEIQASMRRAQEEVQRLTPSLKVPSASSGTGSEKFKEPQAQGEPERDRWSDAHSELGEDELASPETGKEESLVVVTQSEIRKTRELNAALQAEEQHKAKEAAEVEKLEELEANAQIQIESFKLQHEEAELKKREAAQARQSSLHATEELKAKEAAEFAEVVKLAELETKARELGQADEAIQRAVLEEEAKVIQAAQAVETARHIEEEQKKKEAEEAQAAALCAEEERRAHEAAKAAVAAVQAEEEHVEEERVAREAAHAEVTRLTSEAVHHEGYTPSIFSGPITVMEEQHTTREISAEAAYRLEEERVIREATEAVAAVGASQRLAREAEEAAEAALLAEEAAKQELKAHRLAEAAARAAEEERRAREAVEAVTLEHRVAEAAIRTRESFTMAVQAEEALLVREVQERSLTEVTFGHHQTAEATSPLARPHEEDAGFQTPSGRLEDLTVAAQMMMTAAEAQTAEEEELFEKLDTNHDGVISRSEFEAGIRSGLLQEALHSEEEKADVAQQTSFREEEKVDIAQQTSFRDEEVEEYTYLNTRRLQDVVEQPTALGRPSSAAGAGGSGHEQGGSLEATSAYTGTRLQPISENSTDIEEDAHMEQLQKLIEQAAAKGWDGTGDHRHHQMVRAAQQHLKKLQKKKALRRADAT